MGRRGSASSTSSERLALRGRFTAASSPCRWKAANVPSQTRRATFAESGNLENILIFANPIAGRGEGAAIARQLEERLRADGYAVRTFLDRPEEIDVKQLDAGARAAIVIGGDGTLRAVADRLFRTPGGPSATTPPGPPLLAVPLGTANLMGRHLGIQWQAETLAERVSEVVARCKVIRLDTARANGQLFLLMAGVGFDAHVVHELQRARAGPIRFTSYLLPAALAMGYYEYAALRVIADGREVFPSAPAIAFVGNISEYGTGFPILPDARPDDGVLDLCVLPCNSRAQVMSLFLMAAAGEHTQAEGSVYLKVRHVRIESDHPIPVQVDGDTAGHTPVEIDLLPLRLPFIVP